MDFILRTAKRKLPLHENSFVKATAPFLLFAEIKTILHFKGLFMVCVIYEDCYSLFTPVLH